MHYELGEADTHVKWTFSRLRFMSSILKDKLRKDGIWEDFLQELYATGFNAWQRGMDMAETRRYAGRQIHNFFKGYGYKAYRNSYVRWENCFSAMFADWQVSNLAAEEAAPNNLMGKDTAGDNHLQEQIVSALKRRPEGMTRADLSMFLEVPVREIQERLDSLLKEKQIVEVIREAWEGRISPLYLIAGAKIPEQKPVRTERYERIRQAYFEERRSISSIAREYHHSFHTIYRAIRSAPVPVAFERKELIPA